MYYESYASAISGWFLLFALLYLIGAMILAYEFNNVAAEKGYTGTNKYFWYCLLFSIGGWLLVCALPNRKAPTVVSAKEAIQKKQKDELDEALKF